MLQEKVYDLKRDIEKLQNNNQNIQNMQQNAQNIAEMNNLRAAAESLQLRNTQLEAQIRAAEVDHATESQQIREMYTELGNCRQLLDDVLSQQ